MKIINVCTIFVLLLTATACNQLEYKQTIKKIKPQTYTVVFDANGGKGSMPNQNFTCDVTSDLTANIFTKASHTFSGWSVNPHATTADYGDCQSVKNLTNDKHLTLYALWTESGKMPPVIFTPSNGKIDYTDEVSLSCSIKNAVIYYTTDGSTPTERSNKYTEPITINSDTTLKAVAVKSGMNNSAISTVNYKIKTYTVTFEDESENLPVKFPGLKKNDTLKEEDFPILTKSGYTFVGWYNEDEKFTSRSLISKDIVLTAGWIPNIYNVIFNANGGKGSMAIQKFIYDVTDDLTVNAFTKTNYTFSGWSANPQATTADYVNKQAVKNLANTPNITLYAIWTEKTTVTPVIFTPPQGEIDYADKVTLSCFPKTAVIYYTTDGSTPTEHSNKYTEPITINSNTTLKAVAVKSGMKNSAISTVNYTIKTYTVTFEDKFGNSPAAITGLKKNDTIKKEVLPILTKDGYTFAGWYNKDKKFTSQSLISENIKLTAKWLVNTYNVIFDSSGGKGSMANQKFTYDVTSDLATNTFTMPNYTFCGWTKNPQITTANYANKQSVKNLTTDENITLYAIWKRKLDVSKKISFITARNMILNLEPSKEPYTIKITGQVNSNDLSIITKALKINNKTKVILDFSDSKGLESVEKNTFKNCTNLVGISLGKYIKTIEDGAFADCTNLQSVTSGSRLKEIGKQAFFNCKDLTNVALGKSLETIESQAFKNCYNLTNITWGNKLKIVGTQAFGNCYNLTNIALGDSLEIINRLAFLNCKSLTSVTWGNKLMIIGHNAFENCYSLINITLGNALQTIQSQAFKNCYNLNFIASNKNNVYSVSDDNKILFNKSKTKLIAYPSANENITIPNHVTTIEKYAFSNCSGLSNLIIPDSVLTIRDYAFENCVKLSNLTIPDSVISIGDYAFSYCTGLSSVTIPNSTISISDTAFYQCYNLKIK